MRGRGEPVPFAFVSEAERFRSNVTPPPREPVGRGRIAAWTLAAMTVVAALVGAVLLGAPALDVHQAGSPGVQQADSGHHH
ncbi:MULTISPECIES: hypothetical protein [Streptomycetaceae]|uniref:Uncharacterized protein n=1 Tax=Streptantibioticus cattleyicolor (strain ATCC 35852 / DSM 46488 / JCM 4925 / NBRC 14057 / NRRL 8057) TaxID=1003195 RepID=F8JUQ1_STREN|nr:MULTISPECIES: hypothetical protein [Streptomycetaceae]AEW96880.1 hypothetical protein SCATT_45090 [Streptantibioticus cattleyicolor NRRL 8057 = DSM 46488]MYS61358.1 hypothetical protein [Streptomyces sp. SID5468]CCB77209.1 conserved protein of unknown function [Streptantibioticus cattleyicolor NRRL 8057 = DSM 46488]